jgi:hypothetical protein
VVCHRAAKWARADHQPEFGLCVWRGRRRRNPSCSTNSQSVPGRRRGLSFQTPEQFDGRRHLRNGVHRREDGPLPTGPARRRISAARMSEPGSSPWVEASARSEHVVGRRFSGQGAGHGETTAPTSTRPVGERCVQQLPGNVGLRPHGTSGRDRQADVRG